MAAEPDSSTPTTVPEYSAGAGAGEGTVDIDQHSGSLAS